MSAPLRQRALRLLARRDYARAGLKQKLLPYAGSEAEVDALLDDLAARCLLSDARYAEMRVLARGGRYGNARLAQELRQQGVDAETAATALAGAGDEMTRAHAVWRQKFAALPADGGERGRQARYLMNRGFSPDTIRRLLRGEVPAAAEREEE